MIFRRFVHQFPYGLETFEIIVILNEPSEKLAKKICRVALTTKVAGNKPIQKLLSVIVLVFSALRNFREIR